MKAPATPGFDHELPIPTTLNATLVVLTTGACLGLLLLAEHLQGVSFAAAVVAYCLLFQTVYALFHEASHRKLHPDRRWNRFLGGIVGTLFGMSVTMFSITHWGHHLKNRTDEEAFDQVAPGESWGRKATAWYFMMFSGLYWAIPVMNVWILLAPTSAARLAVRVRIADSVFREPPAVLRRIRFELLVWLLFTVTLFAFAGPAALAMHAVAAWVWSSTNYVDHAYSPRDVHQGAFNLRAPLYGWLNLHRELDRTHHVWPDASWIHLPRLTAAKDGWFFAHWLRQWRGPVHTTEPAPRPLDAVPVTPLPPHPQGNDE